MTTYCEPDLADKTTVDSNPDSTDEGSSNAAFQVISQVQIIFILMNSNFSNEEIYYPGMKSPDKFVHFIPDACTFRNYNFEIYPNGSNKLNKGYVSLLVYSLMEMRNFEMTCTISVVDALYNLRFPMTFTFSLDSSDITHASSETSWKRFNIDQYIKRETLLKEPAELLPNDVLTLHITIQALNSDSDLTDKQWISMPVDSKPDSTDEESAKAAFEVINDLRCSSEKTEIKQVHTTLILMNSYFSNEEIYYPGMKSPDKFVHFIPDALTFRDYIFEIYPNGSNKVNKGYVSLLVHSLKKMTNFEMTCIISVIDAFGNPRFPMTFTFSSDSLDIAHASSERETSWEIFNIHQYIKRETLLKEPAELLPNDVLTLHIDIQASGIKESIAYPEGTICNSFIANKDANESVYYLLLDSVVAKYLSEESNYFQRILVSSMLEKTERRMKIPKKEYVYFVDAVRIVIGKSPLVYESIYRIFEVYVIADKYDIPLVTETCLCFLKLCLSDHDVAEILDVADEYSHWNLKEILKNYFNSNKGIGVASDEMFWKQINKECKWTYKQINSNSNSYLHFEKKSDKETIFPEILSFDFYH